MRLIKPLLAATALATTAPFAFADHHQSDEMKQEETSAEQTRINTETQSSGDMDAANRANRQGEAGTGTTPATARQGSAADQRPQASPTSQGTQADRAAQQGETRQAGDAMGEPQGSADNGSANRSMTADSSGTSAGSDKRPQDIDTVIVYTVGDYNPAYLASAWLGESVYNSEGDEVGDVDDLIMTRETGLEAVVLSVGGFWNIASEKVAIPLSDFRVTFNENDSPRLTIPYTEDQLVEMAGG